MPTYLAKIEDLVGAVDGVNREFATPGGEAFVLMSEVVFVRGLPRVRTWDDGWTVLDADAGLVRLNEAPLAGDAVAMLYATEIPDLTEVTEIVGRVDLANTTRGQVQTHDLLGVAVRGGETLSGSVDEGLLTGTLVEHEVRGSIEVCA